MVHKESQDLKREESWKKQHQELIYFNAQDKDINF